jgi:hypothetical protein
MEIFEENYRSKVQDEDENVLDSSEELVHAYTPRVNNQEVLSAPLGLTTVMHLGVDLDPSGNR